MNSDRITDRIVRQALRQAGGTRGDLDTMNIMWTMGSDFQVSHDTHSEIEHHAVEGCVRAEGDVESSLPHI